jgi:hypothetical protein
VDGKSSALTVNNLRDVAKFLTVLAFRRAKKVIQPGKRASEKGELG